MKRTLTEVLKENLYIAVTLFLLSFVLPGYAQNNEKNRKHHNVTFGVEFGSDLLFGETIKPDKVRESKSSYYLFDDYDFYCGLLWDYQTINITYLGIKSEMFFAKNRLGLASGIRLSRYSTSLDSDRDYFLWNLQQDETNTEYVRIRKITQNSFYVGIPFEVKFFPNKREMPAQFYVKTGAAFNYRINTINKIIFHNPSMNFYDETISNYTNRNLTDFNAYLFLGCGLKIGRFSADKKRYAPIMNIEIHAVNVMFTEAASSFINTTSGFGLQLSVQIPLGKTVAIGARN